MSLSASAATARSPPIAEPPIPQTNAAGASMVPARALSIRQSASRRWSGIARAVVAKPRIILADEPTGNLHSEQGKEIMEMFKKLNEEGTTIVQVTHSEVNAAYGNRIVRLEDGWIVKE